jgi:hypothetical protein
MLVTGGCGGGSRDTAARDASVPTVDAPTVAADGGAIARTPDAEDGATMPPDGGALSFAIASTLLPLHAGPDGPLSATETMDIVPHGNRTFVALSQWMQPVPTGAQVLVQDTAEGPFRVFARFAASRVAAMRSFELPAGAGATRVLLAQGHSNASLSPTGSSSIVWLVDGDTTFTGELRLQGDISLRSFGMHVDGSEIGFYAGTRPAGILHGTWSGRTIVWDTNPELRLGDGSTDGFRYTGMADCGGALYATNETVVYRRNDGALPAGVPRWVPVTASIGTAAAGNSGLRGLTCIQHQGRAALLVSPEGDGSVLRIDALPVGLVRVPMMLSPATELDVRPRVRAELNARSATPIPASGDGSVRYVISAYNEFRPMRLGTEEAHVFGVEVGYANRCPAGRFCQPLLTPNAFDVSACFFVRRVQSGNPEFDFHCLDGPEFRVRASPPRPATQGTAFVAVRTLATSPLAPNLVYVGGHDCNSVPSNNTAWIATFPVASIVRR